MFYSQEYQYYLAVLPPRILKRAKLMNRKYKKIGYHLHDGRTRGGKLVSRYLKELHA